MSMFHSDSPSAAEVQGWLEGSPAYQRIKRNTTDKGAYATVAIKNNLDFMRFLNSADPVARKIKQLNLANGQAQNFAYAIDGDGTVQRTNTYGHPTAMRNVGLGAVAAVSGGALLAANAGGAAAPAATSLSALEGTSAAASTGGLTATSLGLAPTAGLGTAGTVGLTAGAGAFDAAGNYLGPSTVTGGGGGSGVLGLSQSELTRYGLNTAGGLVNQYFQNRAAGKAQEVQEKYLQEALAYQKEQDAYARQTDETRYNNSRADFAPYLANGISANDNMARLLGLPARSGGTYAARTGSASAPTADVGEAQTMFLAAMKESGLDPVAVQRHGQVIADAVNKKYPGLGVTVDPTTDAILWPGIGSVDVTVDSGKGGFYLRPDGYQGPSAAGAPNRTYAATVPSATAPAPSATPTSPTVLMRAPDGRESQVPADQVDHYTSRGATLTTPPLARSADAGGLITVQAPNGQTRQVPSSQRDHWLSLGGTVLEGAA